MMRVIIFVFLGSMVIAGCRNGETYKEQDLFFDYKISAEEGSDSAAVLVQFRLRNVTGPTVQLRHNARVLFDEEEMPVGKAKVTGAYYALSKHIAQITGMHSITYISADGKEHKKSFEYHPFQLANALPDTIMEEDQVLDLSGLDSVDHLEFLLNDTSFTSEGINRLITVRNNQYILPSGELSRLNPGPLQLELQKAIEIRFGAGVIVTSYVIRRELWLKKK